MKNEELPAFANPGSDQGPGSAGLSKREYFAAMAMNGFFTPGSIQSEQDYEYIAEHSVRMADAMLKALES